jgi:hypothetical protein
MEQERSLHAAENHRSRKPLRDVHHIDTETEQD